MAGDTVIRHGKARIELKGFEELFKKLEKVGVNAVDAAQDVFAQATKRVHAKSQALVPVDTGALKASGRVSKPRVNKRTLKVTASVNYGGGRLKRLAPGESPLYAIFVHENPNGAGYKFLERPMTTEKAAVMRELGRRITERVAKGR